MGKWLVGVLWLLGAAASAEEGGAVDATTGLVIAPGWEAVRTHCTGCHSARLITQNRATRDGWQDIIRWMQQTQGLWPLGEAEPRILDYLARYYGVSEVPGSRRRLPLLIEE